MVVWGALSTLNHVTVVPTRTVRSSSLKSMMSENTTAGSAGSTVGVGDIGVGVAGTGVEVDGGTGVGSTGVGDGGSGVAVLATTGSAWTMGIGVRAVARAGAAAGTGELVQAAIRTAATDRPNSE